jgi:hypothetical protein
LCSEPSLATAPPAPAQSTHGVVWSGVVRCGLVWSGVVWWSKKLRWELRRELWGGVQRCRLDATRSRCNRTAQWRVFAPAASVARMAAIGHYGVIVERCGDALAPGPSPKILSPRHSKCFHCCAASTRVSRDRVQPPHLQPLLVGERRFPRRNAFQSCRPGVFQK